MLATIAIIVIKMSLALSLCICAIALALWLLGKTKLSPNHVAGLITAGTVLVILAVFSIFFYIPQSTKEDVTVMGMCRKEPFSKSPQYIAKVYPACYRFNKFENIDQRLITEIPCTRADFEILGMGHNYRVEQVKSGFQTKYNWVWLCKAPIFPVEVADIEVPPPPKPSPAERF